MQHTTAKKAFAPMPDVQPGRVLLQGRMQQATAHRMPRLRLETQHKGESMTESTKNPHAQALGRLRRGIKEKPSAGKRANAVAQLAAARAKRWPVKPSGDAQP